MIAQALRLLALTAALGPSAAAPAAELTWTARADVTGESFGRGLHGGGVLDGRIVLAGGGYVGTSLWGSYASTVVYDPVTDTWSPAAAMPRPRAAPAAAVSSDTGAERLYVIGGLDLTDFPLAHEAVPGIAAYDPVADSWTTVGLTLPDGLRTWGACAVEVDGLVYVMGGADASFASASARLAAYDPSSDTFATLTQMPAGRSDGACAAADGVIYHLGGYLDGAWGGPPTDQVLAYDIVADAWHLAAAPMPTPRANAGAVALEAGILVVGGWNGSGQYGGLYASVDLYHPGLDAWEAGLPSPLGCVPDDGSSVRGRAGLTLHVADPGSGPLLYAAGGNVGISLPTRCHESSPLPTGSVLFADSFETATTHRWSGAIP